MLREFTFVITIVPAVAICFHLLRWRQDGQVAADDEAAIEAEVVGEHARVKGIAVGDEENLFKVLAECGAGDNVNEGLGAGAVKVAEWFVEYEEAGGSSEVAREGSDGKSQA